MLKKGPIFRMTKEIIFLCMGHTHKANQWCKTYKNLFSSAAFNGESRKLPSWWSYFDISSLRLNIKLSKIKSSSDTTNADWNAWNNIS